MHSTKHLRWKQIQPLIFLYKDFLYSAGTVYKVRGALLKNHCQSNLKEAEAHCFIALKSAIKLK